MHKRNAPTSKPKSQKCKPATYRRATAQTPRHTHSSSPLCHMQQLVACNCIFLPLEVACAADSRRAALLLNASARKQHFNSASTLRCNQFLLHVPNAMHATHTHTRRHRHDRSTLENCQSYVQRHVNVIIFLVAAQRCLCGCTPQLLVAASKTNQLLELAMWLVFCFCALVFLLLFHLLLHAVSAR